MVARCDKGSHTRATTHGACAAAVQDDVSCMLVDVDLLPTADAGEKDVILFGLSVFFLSLLQSRTSHSKSPMSDLLRHYPGSMWSHHLSTMRRQIRHT